MIYRDIFGLKLSGLGLGTMRLPVVNGQEAVIDEAAAADMIDYAYTHGINYFDTAWGYHDGNSEPVVGKCLSRYPRERFYLASKFPGYDNSNMPKAAEIFEKQLVRCQTPYFDFYLIHNVYEGNIDDYLDPKFGILDYFLKQKEAGRIRHLGFSFHGSVPVLERFLEGYGAHMEFGQLQLNYMDWHFQDTETKAAILRRRHIPIWVMEPLRGGKLAKASPALEAKMKALRPKETVPGWAFRFIQGVEGVTMVLSGMSNMQQLQQNMQIWETDEPLTPKEVQELLAITDEEVKRCGVPCTACHYCTSHCPQGLPIPELIAYYNEHVLTGGGFLASMGVGSLPGSQRPSSCVGCRSCERVCPQQIKISEVLADFSEKIGM